MAVMLWDRGFATHDADRCIWISARGRTQCRFGFNLAASCPKQVPKVERRRCIRRIAIHQVTIQPLGLPPGSESTDTHRK